MKFVRSLWVAFYIGGRLKCLFASKVASKWQAAFGRKVIRPDVRTKICHTKTWPMNGRLWGKSRATFAAGREGRYFYSLPRSKGACGVCGAGGDRALGRVRNFANPF
jgi:hypothetical protein